jgi:hypothetical protein
MKSVFFQWDVNKSFTSKTVRIAQSVKPLPKGWMTEGSEFESRWGQEFSPLHIVQTGSGAHPASNQVGTGCSFPGGKAAGV